MGESREIFEAFKGFLSIATALFFKLDNFPLYFIKVIQGRALHKILAK